MRSVLNPRLLTIPQLLSGAHPSTVKIPAAIVRTEKHKFKYEVVMTVDEDTPGYSSSFILLKSDPPWGFHLLWTPIDGALRSCTAGFRVKLGKYTPREFGIQFLKTFNLVLSRSVKREHILGDSEYLREVAKTLRNFPRFAQYWDGKLKERDGVNLLLMNTYGQMWDLEVNIAKFEEIPQDVVDDYHAFVDQEFEND